MASARNCLKQMNKKKSLNFHEKTDDINGAITQSMKNDIFNVGGKASKVIGDTIEKDPIIESELFDSRQKFLNFCQLNHFQFDDLRRAKHSTTMILFHLHNPTAPKFLQQCGACYREITNGKRYHCGNCPNFNLCQDCYEPIVTGLWEQRDSRFTHNKNHIFTAVDMETSTDNELTCEERAMSIKIHLELLGHAANCNGAPGCSSSNCQRMKLLFNHLKTCNGTYTGCKVCTRFTSLLSIHARQCKAQDLCRIPLCSVLREKNRRLEQQQQLMDERRRKLQNELHLSNIGQSCNDSSNL